MYHCIPTPQGCGDLGVSYSCKPPCLQREEDCNHQLVTTVKCCTDQSNPEIVRRPSPADITTCEAIFQAFPLCFSLLQVTKFWSWDTLCWSGSSILEKSCTYTVQERTLRFMVGDRFLLTPLPRLSTWQYITLLHVTRSPMPSLAYWKWPRTLRMDSCTIVYTTLL